MTRKGFFYSTVGLLVLASIFTITLNAPGAISRIIGMAVAQSGTLWNNVKDFTVGDGITKGAGLSVPCLYNGVTCDRQRGDITNGADVDVTRTPGGAFTPADAVANPTGLMGAEVFPMLSDGSTWNQLDNASANNLAQSASRGALLQVPLTAWSVTSTPAVATQATASKAAGAGSVRHVATVVSFCEAAGATPQLPIIINLRDGATGAGTIIRSWTISVLAGTSECYALPGLAMIGTAATAMTIEFAAAGAAATQQTVALSGFSVP